MLLLKSSVRFSPGQATAFIAQVVAGIYAEYGYDAVVTSANDSRHKPDSFHYRGEALDFRVHNVPSDLRPHLVARIKAALPMCDVLWESKSTPNEHLHIEYDPKD